MDIQFFQHRLLKRLSFLQLPLFLIQNQLNIFILMGQFLDFLFCSTYLLIYLYTNTTLSGALFGVLFGLLKLDSVSHKNLSLFKLALAILALLQFQMNFKISVSIKIKVCWDFNWNGIESID